MRVTLEDLLKPDGGAFFKKFAGSVFPTSFTSTKIVLHSVLQRVLNYLEIMLECRE